MSTPARAVLSALALGLFALPSAAQIQWGGTPPSAAGLPGVVPTIAVAAPDVVALRAEDALRGKDEALRYGVPLAVDAGPEDAGLWVDLPSGDRVWRLRVTAPGARSLSLTFSMFNLLPGQQLWVHDDARASVLGSFTDLNNKASGIFATFPTPGDGITLELLDPAGSAGPAVLRLDGVVYDYTDVLGTLSTIGGPSSGRTHCETDVACSVGAPWTNQIDATTRLLAGGALCSGSLVNNTLQDGTQLYFSANHCGSLNGAVFLFNYQTSGCGSGAAPQTQSVVGSTKLASSSSLDYQLVRINTTIPSSYSPYLAGWDRSGTTPANTVTTHHPGGGPKKISFDYNAPGKSGNDWRIFQWDVGVTEGGSSGCPLYDPSGRYIGNLWGGAATCSYPYDDYYTRLQQYWSQVSTHLDPAGTGATTMTGFDPYGGPSGGTLDITSVSPSTIDALMPGTTQAVTINGTGFTPTSTVTVDGISLGGFPSPVSWVSSTKIVVDMPMLAKLGSVSIVVSDGVNSDSESVTIVAPDPPALQIGAGDEPVNLFSFTGADVTVSAGPGDLFFLYFSTDAVPSVLPGVVSFGIGNGFTKLWPAGIHVVDPVQAWTKTTIPFSGVPPLSTFHFQGFSIPAVPTFPVSVSNTQQVQVVF